MIRPTEGNCFVTVFCVETGIKNVRQSLKNHRSLPLLTFI